MVRTMLVAPATTPGPRPVSRTTAEPPNRRRPSRRRGRGRAQADPTTLEEALLLLAKKSGGATAPATAARQPASADSEAPEVDAGAFSVRAGEITWVCKWCEARNLLAEQSCSVCGASFGEVLKEEKQQVTRVREQCADIAVLSRSGACLHGGLGPGSGECRGQHLGGARLLLRQRPGREGDAAGDRL